MITANVLRTPLLSYKSIKRKKRSREQPTISTAILCESEYFSSPSIETCDVHAFPTDKTPKENDVADSLSREISSNSSLSSAVEDFHQHLFLIKSNSPALTYLTVSPQCIFSVFPSADEDWEKLGKFIGENTHLRAFCFRRCTFGEGLGAISIENLTEFSKGFCNNRSIERIAFERCNLDKGGVFKLLAPFFENNESLSSLRVWSHLAPEDIDMLRITLAGCKSLKSIDVCSNEMKDESLADFFASFSGMPNLEGLKLGGYDIGRDGCMALATLLQNDEIRLKKLSLRVSNINDDGMVALSRGLVNNKVVATLDLSGKIIF